MEKTTKKKILTISSLSLVGAISITFMSLFIVSYNNSKNKQKVLDEAYATYKKEHPMYEGSIQEWEEDMRTKNYGRLKSYETVYNYIYCYATVPPVLASLKSLLNGYQTYAFIERGKTYAGIDKTSFINVGFNKDKNEYRRFTQEEFDKNVNKIKDLNVYGHEHFNIYTTDYSTMEGIGLASCAGLTDKQYHFYMCEDGTASYAGLREHFLNGKKVTDTIDEPFDTFKNEINIVKDDINKIMSNKSIKVNDPLFATTYNKTYALSGLNTNFTLVLQDKNALAKAFESTGKKSKMADSFGVGDNSPEIEASVLYESISEDVDKLNDKKKEEYVKLMYGDYYEKTYKTLKRKTLSDGVTQVPVTKMIFIPGRIRNFQKVASDVNNGIGGLTSDEELPASYSELDEKYKNEFLFDKEEDYNSFLRIFDDSSLWKGNPTEMQKKATKRELFNYLIDYMFTLKYSHKIYGNKYDIIMKGHPSEEIDLPETWSNHYVTSGDEASGGGYTYDYLMSAAAIDFHNNNSVGKYIGMVPYGTAAENLAYLGVNIGLGGLPSSTYTGYDTSVPVEFVMNLIDGNITKDDNLAARYNAGNLFYYDDAGKKQITKFLNKGKFYELMRDNFVTSSPTLSNMYDDLRTNWLKKVTGKDVVTGYTIDDQGFVHP